jgi:hypothetical protein
MSNSIRRIHWFSPKRTRSRSSRWEWQESFDVISSSTLEQGYDVSCGAMDWPARRWALSRFRAKSSREQSFSKRSSARRDNQSLSDICKLSFRCILATRMKVVTCSMNPRWTIESLFCDRPRQHIKTFRTNSFD